MARNFSKHLLSHEVFKTTGEDGMQNDGGKFSGTPGNQMCTRGNDLFLAVGQTVRCTDASSDSKTGYKRLELSNVDFAIRSLHINESGTLLAVIGDTKVVACVLPPSGALSSRNESCIRLRNRQVGERSGETLEIYKVAWNPIARYDSNLIIMTSDGYLRAYNLSWSYEDPEYVLALCDDGNPSFAVHGSDSFGIDYDQLEDPISFSLGSSAEHHGKITLYVLTRSGDVFGFCPWLPNQFVLSKEEVEDLFDASVSLEYEYRHKTDSKPDVRRHYKQQLAWASQLWKQLSTAMVESRLSPDGSLQDYYILHRPDRPSLDPQGPFNYQPFPSTLYEGEAVDIQAADAGAMTCLAVSYSTGRVTCFLQDISLDMKWKGSGIKPEITLATLESIQLPFDNNSNDESGRPLAIQSDSRQELCLFALENNQVYRIDLSPWAIPLTRAMESGDLKEVERSMSGNIHANVTALVNDKDNSGLKGFAILEDLVGNQYTVIKTHLGVWIDDWPIDEGEEYFSHSSALLPATNSQNPLALMSTNHNNIKETNEELNYETMFNHQQSVEAELKSLLESVDLVAPKPPTDSALSVTGKIPANMEGLEYFDTLSNFFYQELSKVEKAGTIMHKRLQGQRSELHRQLDELGKLSKQITTINENHAPNKLQDVLDRQVNLQRRSGEVLQNLAKSRALLLSEQEKKWFSELKRMQQRIYSGGGFEKRTKNALAQADVILKEFKVLHSDEKSESSLDGTQNRIKGVDADSVAKLQALLTREGEIVESTKKTLQKLLKDNVTDQMQALSI